jgi:hypothetical protein
LYFSPNKALPIFSSADSQENFAESRFVAQQLCKPHHVVEEGRVSVNASHLFHKLINTCVENFTEPQYSGWTSAAFLLTLRRPDSRSFF